MLEFFAFSAAFGFLAAAIVIALGSHLARAWRKWWLPAALAVVFAGFSMVAWLYEGAGGFWVEHTRNHWGNQIWFDLLLAIGVAWALLVPRARRVGMSPWPWLVAVVCTGSVGLCAMLARTFYLEEGSRTST